MEDSRTPIVIAPEDLTLSNVGEAANELVNSRAKNVKADALKIVDFIRRFLLI